MVTLTKETTGKIRIHLRDGKLGMGSVGSRRACRWEIGRTHGQTQANSYRDKTLFKVKHREQLNAVKSLMSMDEKKREKLVTELMLSIVKVVNHAKGVIEKAHFTPNDTFPSETKSDLRDAIANVVENTAFYSNLALHFSSIVLDSYKKDLEWQFQFGWAYNFTRIARLHDDAADKLLDLAGQQLNIIPQRDDFYNPYDSKAIKEVVEREAIRKMEEALRKKQEEKKLERKKKKNKPSLSRSDL